VGLRDVGRPIRARVNDTAPYSRDRWCSRGLAVSCVPGPGADG
jgi:hypothetical protein